MALLSPLNIYKPTTEGLPAVEPGLANYSLLPFEVLVSRIDPSSGEVYVKVSPYSNVYKNFDVTQSIPISGLDFSFPIRSKYKIFLETFYDRNGEPVYSKIKSNTKWVSTVVNPTNKKAVQSYPNSFELITKLDIENKIRELKEDNTNNQSVRTAHIGQIENLKSSGYLTSKESKAFTSLIEQRYADIKTLLDEHISNLPKFFEGTSTLLTKKLFKTINLIAYTTKDLHPNLKGRIIEPTTPLRSGAPPAINISEEEKKFKLVQCAFSDFMIVDANYSNVGAKCLIPWGRGINDYLIDGEKEEKTNTA